MNKVDKVPFVVPPPREDVPLILLWLALVGVAAWAAYQAVRALDFSNLNCLCN